MSLSREFHQAGSEAKKALALIKDRWISFRPNFAHMSINPFKGYIGKDSLTSLSKMFYIIEKKSHMQI